jgi:hypothetical protein
MNNGYTLTRAERRAASVRLFFRVSFTTVLASLVIVTSVWLFILLLGPSEPIPTSVGMVGFALCIPWGFFLGAIRWTDPRPKQFRNLSTVCAANDRYIEFDSGLVLTRYEWAAFRKLRERDGLLYLYITRRFAILVPADRAPRSAVSAVRTEMLRGKQ